MIWLGRHHAIDSLLNRWCQCGLYGGCLGGDYWLLVFFSFPFLEHKYNEIRDVY